MIEWMLVGLLSMAAGNSYQGIGKETIAPEILKKYAPPALDSEMETEIKSMLDIQSPGLGMLHPHRKEVFFTWKVTGVTHVWKTSGNGFPIQMTGGKDSTYLMDITPDGHWLILSRDKDGQENPGLFLQSTEGGELKKIFQKEKVQALYDMTSDDSQWIYFHANDQKADQHTLYRYRISDGITETVFNQPGIWSIADFKKDGTLLLVKYTGSLWREYFEYHPTTQQLVPILGQGEKEEYTVTYARNEKDFLVQTAKFSDFRRLYLLSKGKWTPISDEVKGDVESFQMDRTREHIAYQINLQGYSTAYALDAKNYKKIKLPHFPDAEHVEIGSMTRDGRQMMLSISTSFSPRRGYSYHWKSKKLTQWVVPSAPEINLKKFIKSSLEYYPAKDGTSIPMFVRRPVECEKKSCPVIVHFHGGPEGQSTPGFSPYRQLFLDQGYIFVDPNVRGSDGYGKRWLNADNGIERLKVITDIEDCAKYIRANWKITKIGVMGGSYGGYATLMAMTYFAGAYDVGVSNVGISNLVTFLENTAPYRRILRISEYGDPVQDRDALVKLSPTSYVERVGGALMIIQGVNDPRVPAGEALQMQMAMEKKGLASQLIFFADEGHGSAKKENQVLEIGNTIQFFNKHMR